MEILEHESKQRMTREEAAAVLRELADTLARNNQFAFKKGGIPYKVAVPAEVELEVEIEIGDEGTSVEIELNW